VTSIAGRQLIGPLFKGQKFQEECIALKVSSLCPLVLLIRVWNIGGKVPLILVAPQVLRGLYWIETGPLVFRCAVLLNKFLPPNNHTASTTQDQRANFV